MMKLIVGFLPAQVMILNVFSQNMYSRQVYEIHEDWTLAMTQGP